MDNIRVDGKIIACPSRLFIKIYKSLYFFWTIACGLENKIHGSLLKKD
jgi:hypothetical protein